MSISWSKVCEIVAALPGTLRTPAHGRDGFKAGKKFLCAYNQEENAVGIRIPIDEREMLMQAAPKIYYVTDHYRPYPAVLVSLKHVTERELRQLIERRWRALAPAKIVKSYDEASASKLPRNARKASKGKGITAAQFRKLALSLPESTEGAHMGHADFRVGGKIFATLGYPDKSVGVILLTREEQQLYVAQAPTAFAPVKGGWGLKGSTTVTLKLAKVDLVKSALAAAWRRKAPKAPLKKRVRSSLRRPTA